MKRLFLGALLLFPLASCDLTEALDGDFAAGGARVYFEEDTIPMDDVEKMSGIWHLQGPDKRVFALLPHRNTNSADGSHFTTMRSYELTGDGSAFRSQADLRVAALRIADDTVSLSVHERHAVTGADTQIGLGMMTRISTDPAQAGSTGMELVDKNIQTLTLVAILSGVAVEVMNTLGDDVDMDISLEPDNYNAAKIEQVTHVLASISSDARITKSVRDAQIRRVMAFTGPSGNNRFVAGDTLIVGGSDGLHVTALAREFGHLQDFDTPTTQEIGQRLVSDDASGCAAGGRGGSAGLLFLGVLLVGFRRRRA